MSQNPSIHRKTETPKIRIEIPDEEINDFLIENYEHLGKKAILRAKEFILKKIRDPEFRANPKNYIKIWKSERGGTEELREDEDPALKFFETYLQRLRYS